MLFLNTKNYWDDFKIANKRSSKPSRHRKILSKTKCSKMNSLKLVQLIKSERAAA
jgi:hypothetical protein